MPVLKKDPPSTPPPPNPLGDPRAFQGMSTNLKKLAAGEKRSDFLPSFSRGFGGFLWEVAKIIIIALIIIKPIHAFVLQPFYVKGASMEPNFLNNEYLIIDELSYRFHEPRRGDVVVVHNPVLEGEFLIKRIIGLPGEHLTIDQEGVKIALTRFGQLQLINEKAYLSSNVQTTGSVDVNLGTNEYFVMGDNRPASLDSRSFGPVTRDRIVGRTGVRAWPLHRIRTFPTPTIIFTTPTLK